MHRVFAVALFVLSTLLAPSADAQVSEEPEVPAGVFILGDSHVQMLGPMLSRALSDDGYRVLGYEARPGWSTAAYLRRGDVTELLEEAGRPEVVVVSLGGNDFVRSERQYRAQLAAMVEQVRAAGAVKVIWIGPATSDVGASAIAASTGARHEQNADLQAAALGDLDVTWIDSRPCTCEHHRRDGVHFTRTGYRTWTAALVPSLEAELPSA